MLQKNKQTHNYILAPVLIVLKHLIWKKVQKSSWMPQYETSPVMQGERCVRLKSIFYRHVDNNWPHHTHTVLTKTDTSNSLNTMADPSNTFTSNSLKNKQKKSQKRGGLKV